MKKIVMILLLFVCLCGCISIGGGEEVTAEKLNTLIYKKGQDQAEIDRLLHVADGETLIQADNFGWVIKKEKITFTACNENKNTGNHFGGYYVKKRDAYIFNQGHRRNYIADYYYTIYVDNEKEPEEQIIDFEHWKMLPEIVQKEFKRWK